MMNNEKEKDAIDTSKLDEILPKYDPLKLNSINLAQNYVSAFNTGMNIYQCVNQLQGYIEWVVKAVNDVVKSWNVQVSESIDQSKAIVRETTTEQFNTEWTNKQPELIEQVNTLTTNQFNEDWGVLENRINTTLENQNTNIENIQNEQNELETNMNNKINEQITKINSIQTQQTNLANQQTNLANEQTTLSNRMDTFTSLTEGSTTGDAELKDIRVGANGVTYNNAGDAVRGQYSQLKEDLADYAYRFEGNEISLTFERGGYYADPITGKFDDLKLLRTETPITSHASLDSFYKMYSLDGYEFSLRVSNKLDRNDFGFIVRSGDTDNFNEFKIDKLSGQRFNEIYYDELKQGIPNIGNYDIYVVLNRVDNGQIELDEKVNFITEKLQLDLSKTRIFPRYKRGKIDGSGNIIDITDKTSYVFKNSINCKAGDRFRITLNDPHHNNYHGITFYVHGEKRTINLPIIEIVADSNSFNIEISDVTKGLPFNNLYADLNPIVEKINYRKSTEYDFVVASYDSSESDKEKADIICNNKYAEYQLNCAVNCNITNSNHAKVLLLGGTYNINKFINPLSLGCNYAICVHRSSVGNHRYTCDINGKYHEHSPYDDNNVVIQLTEQASNQLNAQQEFAIVGALRTGTRKMGNAFNMYSLYISNITFKVFSIQKPCVVVDGAGFSQLGCKDLDITRILRENESEIGIYFDTNPPIKGLIGIRGTCGSNNGKGNYIKRCKIVGYYEGIALTGEHFIIEDCLEHHCYYGFTIGNYDVEPQMEHPNVFIGNSVEQCFRLALLNRYGATVESEVSKSEQTLVYIGGSVESVWTKSNGEKVGMLPIKEVVKGAYRGRIEMDWWDSPFENDGSGKRMNYTSYDTNVNKYRTETM